jgi:hypothetical protein
MNRVCRILSRILSPLRRLQLRQPVRDDKAGPTACAKSAAAWPDMRGNSGISPFPANPGARPRPAPASIAHGGSSRPPSSSFRADAIWWWPAGAAARNSAGRAAARRKRPGQSSKQFPERNIAVTMLPKKPIRFSRRIPGLGPPPTAVKHTMRTWKSRQGACPVSFPQALSVVARPSTHRSRCHGHGRDGSSGRRVACDKMVAVPSDRTSGIKRLHPGCRLRRSRKAPSISCVV